MSKTLRNFALTFFCLSNHFAFHAATVIWVPVLTFQCWHCFLFKSHRSWFYLYKAVFRTTTPGWGLNQICHSHLHAQDNHWTNYLKATWRITEPQSHRSQQEIKKPCRPLPCSWQFHEADIICDRWMRFVISSSNLSVSLTILHNISPKG